MASKNKRFADDGWAIWIEGEDISTIYLNEWLDPKGKNYLDMAIRVRGVKVCRMLNVYIPFLVEKAEIEDISLKLRNEDILRAIFSAACIIDYQKNSCTSEIAYNGRTIDLIHLSQCEFTVEPLAEGALLQLDLSKLGDMLDNDEAYMLFRMPHKSLNEIFKPQVDVGTFTQRLNTLIQSPVISERYGYSVRINESRLLPAQINRIGSFHRQKLKKTVVAISVNENYETNESNCYRIRRLEEDLYRDYVPEGFRCEDVITYQWKQDRKENMKGHFNFYFDFTRDAISKYSILIYLFLITVIAIFGNLLYDLVKIWLGIEA